MKILTLNIKPDIKCVSTAHMSFARTLPILIS